MRLFGMGSPLRANDVFGVGGVAQGVANIAAAGIQASAANHAADLSSEAAANSLGFSKDVYNTQQANAQPWLDAGKGALSQLTSGTAPGGSLVTPYGKTFDGGPAFTGPTAADVANDPGYQFRLQQGQQAIERSAAARGGVMGGGVMKDLTNYEQGEASQEYGNAYQRALGTYQTNFQNSLAAYNTNYNAYNTDQSNQFNRLAAISGIGQTANGQLNTAGTAAANNYSQTAMTGAAAAGANITGGANAIGAGIIGAGNTISQAGMFRYLTGNQSFGRSAPTGGNGYDASYDPNSSSYYDTGD